MVNCLIGRRPSGDTERISMWLTLANIKLRSVGEVKLPERDISKFKLLIFIWARLEGYLDFSNDIISLPVAHAVIAVGGCAVTT